jgi:tetratricopeptide (TPR) repeat protein
MRNLVRALPVLFLLAVAIFVPPVLSGYTDLRQAQSAPSYLEAAHHYQSAAQRIPWRADLYELAGHEYYYAKEYSLADAAYQQAFQHHALTAEGWVAWGDVNYLKNDSGRGTEIWEQALAQPNPSEKLYSRLAQSYQEKKEYAKAAAYLQRYVSNHLEDASAHYRLGLLLTLSDPETATSELITAAQLNPDFDPVAQTLRSALNLASLNDSSSERLVIIGRGLGLVGEWELARAVFEESAKTDENNAEAWAWLAEANQQTAEEERIEQVREAAKEYLDRALSLNPNSAVVHALRGLYFQRTDNHREALIEFQAGATLQPDDPALYVSIGESYSKLGDLIRALEAYQYAANLVPKDASYWRLLAQFCGQNNVNIDNVGIPAAQRAVIITGENAEALDLLGWLLSLDARNVEAERTLLHALELDSENASAHFHLAMLYLQTDQPALARDHLILARDLGNIEAQAVLDQYFP